MTFQSPAVLWALLLLAPYAGGEILCVLRGRTWAGRLAPSSDAAASKRAWTRRRAVRALAGAWAWAFAVAALAGPSWGLLPAEGSPAGVEAALVLDVSNSMLATDIRPSRLEAARAAARTLVRLRREAQYSVVAFKGGAVVLCPVTDDADALDQGLEWALPSALSASGTSIGSGILAAVSGFSSAPGISRNIILFSDGNDLAGDSLKAVREARERGIRIIAVGCGGSAEAAALDESGRPVKLPDGGTARTSLRTQSLRALAQEGGGLYLDVTDPAALRTIADALDVRPGSAGARTARRPADRASFLAFLALLGLAVRALGSLPSPGRRRGRRRIAAVLLAALLLTGCSGPRLAVLRGNRLAAQGRYEDAIAAYLAAGPETGDGVVALNLAGVYSRLGERAASSPLYERAQASGYSRVAAAAFHNLGVQYFEAARFEEAAESFIKALRLVPEDLETKRALELARAAAAASRIARSAQRQTTSAGADGKDEALLSLLRRAESDWFRPPASPAEAGEGIDH